MRDTPLIYLFKTINFNYCYDANKNEIIKISKETYDFLTNVLKNRVSLSSIGQLPDNIQSLLSNGYLSNKRVKEIHHQYLDNVENTLSRRMQKVTLQLTQNCNFRCTYCHYTSNDGSQRNHSHKTMSIDLAKKSILYLRDHSIDSPEIHIGFYGGEPLIEFPMLKEIVLYTNEIFRGKKLYYTITTNSVLLTDEILQFFSEQNISMVISLDGPEVINDQNRVFAGSGKGTFKHIINKIKYIYKNYPLIAKDLSINMVMNPKHDFDLINNIFNNYQFLKKLNISASIVDDTGSLEKNTYSENFTSKFTYHEFLAYLYVLKRFPKKKLSPIYYDHDNILQNNREAFIPRNQFLDKDAPGGPCVPGEVRLMVTTEGNFIVCERVNEISDCMRIGDIENGLNFDKVKALLNVASTTSDQCCNCWAFSLCSLCAKYADNYGKLDANTRLSHCMKSRMDAEVKIKRYALLKESLELYGQSTVL